jgi:hypothetical protein
MSDMYAFSQVLAVIGVLSAGIIYGTDVLGALVMRPVWQKVDERTLVVVNGTTHYFADRRMPIPGVLSVVAAVLATVASAVAGHWSATVAASVATAALLSWLAIYFRINAPINRTLTEAAQEGRVPEDARALQTRWDSVIYVRALLQGLAVAGFCIVLVVH